MPRVKMQPKTRPNVGLFLVGLFLGWTGFMKWTERALWIGVVAFAAAHPWQIDWAANATAEAIACSVILTLIGFLCGICVIKKIRR